MIDRLIHFSVHQRILVIVLSVVFIVLGLIGASQVPIDAGTDPYEAWRSLGQREAVMEAFIDLEREVSVIGARGVDGVSSFFDPFENEHRHHILDISVSPADVPRPLALARPSWRAPPPAASSQKLTVWSGRRPMV